MKLLFVALVGLSVFQPRVEHTEIFVVSCPFRWVDADGTSRWKHSPVWAYTLENDAEQHVATVRGCDYTHVLLEP